VGAGDGATRDRRRREPDLAGGRSVGQAARAHDGPVQVPGAQVVLGGGLGRDVGSPDLIGAGPRRLAGPHRGGPPGPAHPGPVGRAGHQHRGSPVDGVLTRGTTACPSPGRKYHRVGPGQQHRDIIGRRRLQIADRCFGTGLLHIGGVGRVPDQSHGLITAPGEQALQQERDLPVPARDHYAHAASLRTGTAGKGAGPTAAHSGAPRILSACLSDFTTSSLTRTTCLGWPGSGPRRSAGRSFPSGGARSPSGLPRTRPSGGASRRAPFPSRARTVCILTSLPALRTAIRRLTACWRWVHAGSTSGRPAPSPGRSWPTRRETSSAWCARRKHSPADGEHGGRVLPGGKVNSWTLPIPVRSGVTSPSGGRGPCSRRESPQGSRRDRGPPCSPPWRGPGWPRRQKAELPEIQAWRRAFTTMGLKPTQYRCASESLLRRLRKEGSLPPLHPLVDLCNAISLAFAIPVAVFDASQITGDLCVRYADGAED